MSQMKTWRNQTLPANNELNFSPFAFHITSITVLVTFWSHFYLCTFANLDETFTRHFLNSLFTFSFSLGMRNHVVFCHTNTSLLCSVTCANKRWWSSKASCSLPGRLAAWWAPRPEWRDCQPRCRGTGLAPGGTSASRAQELWCRHDTAARSRRIWVKTPSWGRDLERHQTSVPLWLSERVDGVVSGRQRGYRQCSPPLSCA